MLFSKPSVRSLFLAAATAGALAASSATAVAAPALRVGSGPGNAGSDAPTQAVRSVNPGNQPGDEDPTDFSRIAREHASHPSRLSQPDDARSGHHSDAFRTTTVEPSAFGVLAHERGANTHAVHSKMHEHARGAGSHAMEDARDQQPNQAWTG